MWYQRLAVAFTIMVLIALVGCAGGAGAPTPQASPPTATPTATPADPRVLTLEVELMEDGPMAEALPTRSGSEPGPAER